MGEGAVEVEAEDEALRPSQELPRADAMIRDAESITYGSGERITLTCNPDADNLRSGIATGSPFNGATRS